MNKSPLNFLSGLAAGLVSSQSNKKNAGKIRKRVSKLENQVTAMVRSQNQGPTPVEQPIDIQPEAQLGTVPNQIGMNQEQSPELLANAPTVVSPFSPNTQQAANSVFGAPIPGSFDRSMESEEEIY